MKPEKDERLQEVLRKVRRLEILMRGRVRESLSGAYQATFRGQGVDFDDFREYQIGDEVRAIDWNVTARMDAPYVKTFIEEREMNVILALDISPSMEFGSVEASKREVLVEALATIAFSAVKSRDKVGLLLFSQDIELYIPPAPGSSHALRILREMLYRERTPTKSGSQNTSFAPVWSWLSSRLRRRSLVFVASDFLGESLDHHLGVAALRHDVISLWIEDPAEINPPALGKIRLQDPETGTQRIVHLGKQKNLDQYHQNRHAWEKQTLSTFQKHGASVLRWRTDEDFMPVLRSFFRRTAKSLSPGSVKQIS